MIDPGLRNRSVLITGANNPFGIGAAAAVAFARQGARLFLHYFRSPNQDLAPTDVPGDVFYRLQQTMSCGEQSALLPRIPLRRLGTPEDAADALVFFCSEQARWVTGQRIFVGGGHQM